jgi:hypothetical protein
MLGQARYRMRAVLTPSVPSSPASARRHDAYSGTLAVHVDDGRGHDWEHVYPAHGAIDLEGDTVVAPAGLEVPGASAPSPAYDARHGQMPGVGPYRSVDLYLDVELFDDPRH